MKKNKIETVNDLIDILSKLPEEQKSLPLCINFPNYVQLFFPIDLGGELTLSEKTLYKHKKSGYFSSWEEYQNDKAWIPTKVVHMSF